MPFIENNKLVIFCRLTQTAGWVFNSNKNISRWVSLRQLSRNLINNHEHIASLEATLSVHLHRDSKRLVHVHAHESVFPYKDPCRASNDENEWDYWEDENHVLWLRLMRPSEDAEWWPLMSSSRFSPPSASRELGWVRVGTPIRCLSNGTSKLSRYS